MELEKIPYIGEVSEWYKRHIEGIECIEVLKKECLSLDNTLGNPNAWWSIDPKELKWKKSFVQSRIDKIMSS